MKHLVNCLEMSLLAVSLFVFAGCGSDDEAVENIKPAADKTEQGKNTGTDSQGKGDETGKGNFCVEGKTWTLSKTAVVKEPYVYEYKETTLKGDTVVGGITFKKMYTRTYKPGEPAPETWTDTHCWLGEDGGKVCQFLEVNEEVSEISVLFDFSAEEGDTVHWVLGDTEVKRVTNIPCTDGKDRKTMFLYLYNKSDGGYGYVDTWIEDVGSVMYGISDSNIDAHTVGTKLQLEKCTVGSTVIFDRAAMEQSILPGMEEYILSDGK